MKAVVPLAADRKIDVVRRLKTVRGHIEGIIDMVEDDAYCIEVLKQLSAVRSALDRVGRIELRHHLEQCFREAVKAGQQESAIAELMETLAYDKELV
ncbi:MAG TPA: metal-sensitive transcriptional regulator [Candidatus Baltobacteraceae bacterium]|nr:metal-sensitive transcriptional regulator [Candidatus Baltobacteraceae bacterium]